MIDMIRSIKDMHKPAIASPLGFFAIPMAESITPKIQRMTFTTGIQQRIRLSVARTNPAVPTPFVLCSSCRMIIVCCGVPYEGGVTGLIGGVAGLMGGGVGLKLDSSSSRGTWGIFGSILDLFYKFMLTQR